MNAGARRNKIIRLISKKGSLTVKELSELLGVSEPTIRRDLVKMEEQQTVARIWGGVRIADSALSPVTEHLGDQFALKFSRNLGAKQAIARYAASQIKNNTCVYVDAGSTCPLIFNYIEASGVTIVSPTIYNVETLVKKNIKLFTPHGYVDFSAAAVMSAETAYDLQRINYSIAFLGASALDSSGEFSSRDNYDVAAKEAVIKGAEKVFVLCDSSKFDTRLMYTFATISDCTLITDKDPGFGIPHLIVVGTSGIPS